MDELGTASPIPEVIRDTVLRNRFPILFAVMSVSLLMFSLILLVKTTQTTDVIEFSEPKKNDKTASNDIIVDISGAIVHPGVYEVKQGSRIVDVITLAGGVSTNVSEVWLQTQLNQAALLKDGMKLYIFNKSEYEMSHNSGNVLNPVKTSYNNNIGLDQQRVSGLKTISINTATVADLDSLPGIGSVIANKIISNRPYQDLDDLLTKKVMSQSLLDKLKNSLSL